MLVDCFGRTIDYLRISVTERCNFRCLYCKPDKFVDVGHCNIMSYEEMFEFVKICIDNGVIKVRITGGEPLVRKGVENFVKMISDYAPSIDLAMTTNGYFLAQKAEILRKNGLKRLNISLDTLDAKKAAFIAQKEIFDNVISGIKKASELGFTIKINTVALKGINDDELIGLMEFAKGIGAQIRFIEFMENSHANDHLRMLPRDEILQIISAKYSLKEITKSPNSPSSLFELSDSYKFGIIAPHRSDFCASCNRIRLSADGLLIPCLYFEDAKSIKEAMRSGDTKRAHEILYEVIANKPEKNRWNSEISSRAFYETGG